MVGERRLPMHPERILNRETRGDERPEFFEEDRNVEMRANFGRSRILLEGIQRLAKIEELRDFAITSHRCLTEVDGVGEDAQLGHEIEGELLHPERGGFLQFEDGDTRVDQARQRGGDVLEADGLVPDVEDDTEMPAEKALGPV